jgi:hypothetical protein
MCADVRDVRSCAPFSGQKHTLCAEIIKNFNNAMGELLIMLITWREIAKVVNNVARNREDC